MTRPRPASTVSALLVAAVAALTSWAATWSWLPLADDTSWSLPLLAGCLAIGGVGAAGRLLAAPRLATVGVQVVLATGFLLLWTTGSPVPTPNGLATLVDQLRAGGDAAFRYTVPVPESAPVTALLLLGGLATAVVVDAVAVGWSRVGLAGVVLLAVHVIPANLQITPSWAQFAVVSLGFLALLHLVQVETFHRWDSHPARTAEDGEEAGARYASTPAALTIAAAAVAIATVTGAAVPLAGVAVWDGPGRGGGTNGVAISNPLVDMRRDLTRGWDVPLLRIAGETQRRPTYVRLATLNTFNGREWSSGNRTAPATQTASGLLPELAGVDAEVPRQTFEWDFTASQAFSSRWLPTPSQVAGVNAPGDWRYDLDSRDFVAWDEALTTAGLRWRATETVLDLKGERLDKAPDGRRSVDRDYTALPDSLPTMVEDLAESVAGDETSQFRQARALQSWFRSEFTYSLEQVDSVGNDDLVAFLSADGREGYCEQFAAAMAVMARSLGIPARVVVGFLSPEKARNDPATWVFSAHDLHAWPELFFPGSGWVRFEPTPASRASGAPSYSTVDLPSVEEPSTAPSSTASADPQAPRPENRRPEEERAEETAEQDAAFPWGRVAAGLLSVLALGAVGAAPRAVRSRRRSRRLASSDPEQWWDEVRDTAVDLGLEWPGGRSVRVAGAWLAERTGRPWPAPGATTPGGEIPSVRADSTTDPSEPQVRGAIALVRAPSLGQDDPVSRLVGALERTRYGRGDSTHTLREDALWLRERLTTDATRTQRWVAAWLPRSLWR